MRGFTVYGGGLRSGMRFKEEGFQLGPNFFPNCLAPTGLL